MSVSMTLDAVRNRTKTVTRRHVDSWQHLKVGDHLTLIEKGMGLPKGAKQVVVCEVLIVSVRVEPLGMVSPAEVRREGLWERALANTDNPPNGRGAAACDWFIQFWCKGHGYRGLTPEQEGDVECRRIEWVYLDPPPEPTDEPLSAYEDTDGDQGEDAVRERQYERDHGIEP